MNQPVDKMVNQYFRWRCELLDNRPIQGEFNKYNWKWWKMWDGYYDLNGEMIQLPRWMCYDQQLTVVKQKCKEFVKVAIQWIWRDMFKKKEGIYFKFSLSFIVYLCTFLNFCFTISWRPTTKRSDDGDEPTSWQNGEPILQMEMWATWQQTNSVKTVGNGERCEMDTTTCMVKWSNNQDGCVMTNSWLVKPKCKEFVKVAIQWNCRVIFKKIQGIYFQFSVWCIVFLCTFLFFCFTISWRPTTKKKRRQW